MRGTARLPDFGSRTQFSFLKCAWEQWEEGVHLPPVLECMYIYGLLTAIHHSTGNSKLCWGGAVYRLLTVDCWLLTAIHHSTGNSKLCWGGGLFIDCWLLTVDCWLPYTTAEEIASYVEGEAVYRLLTVDCWLLTAIHHSRGNSKLCWGGSCL